MARTAKKYGLLVHRKDGKALSEAESSALTAWVDSIRGRARTWTHDAEDIGKKAAGAELRMEQAGIPMSLRPGATMTVTPPGPAANAYGHSVTSCRYTLVRKATGWVITSYITEGRYPRTPRHDNIVLTTKQVESLYRAALQRGRFELPKSVTSIEANEPKTPMPILPEIGEAAESMMVTPMPEVAEEVRS